MKSSAPQRSQNAVRQRVKLRISPTAAACSALLFAMSAAYAQDATAPAAGTANLDTVTVTGIRHAIESSIATKRNSDSIVEVVTAEDIGKLPDASIAESLARLPGLAAQRVDGRAQVISIRGMSPDFSGTLLNGREQATTNTNRGVQYDQYPSELINSALVYKTPDGTLLGQGLAGTVDMRSVRPLDMAGRAVALNLRGEHNSNGALNGSYGGTSADGMRFSASYVDQFADRTIGVALGFAHLDTPGQQQHYKAWGFQNDSNCLAHTADWGCGPVTGLPTGANYLNGFEITSISRVDKRDGLMGVLEFKPNKDLHSTVDLFYSKFTQTEVMRGLMGSVGDGWGSPGSTFSNVTTTSVGGLPLVTGAKTMGGPNMVVRNDYNTRKDEVGSFGWNTEAKLGSGWKGIADVSYSMAKRDESLFETYAGTGATPTNLTFTIPSGNGFPTFSSPTNYSNPATVLLSDPAGWGHDGRLSDSTMKDTIKSLNLHGKHDLSGIFTQVDTGVNYTERDKVRNYNVDFATLKSGLTSQAVGSSYLASPVSLAFAGIPSVLSYDVNAVANQYYTMTQNLSNGITGDMAKDFGVHERVTTAYAKADIDTEMGIPWRGNLGLQMIHTNQYSDAYAFDPKTSNPTGIITPGLTYNDFLPSLNLVGDLGHDRVVRLALAKTMSRPRIDDMNASSSASVATSGPTTGFWSGSGGNPKLLPWRSKDVDLSFEQYLGKGSYVSAAVFYKKLDTYIYPSTITNYNFSGYVNGSGTPAVSPIGTFSGPANGTGGNMRGIELAATLQGSLLSSSLDGFGVQATSSFTNSSIQVLGPGGATPIWATLPGLSKTVAGLTLFYEKHGVAVRVSDRYRSDFRGEYTSLFGATAVYRTLAQNLVDFQTSYEFQKGAAKGLSLVFQVVNLTNAQDRSLQDGSGFGTVTAPQETNAYGRQFLIGVNYKM